MAPTTRSTSRPTTLDATRARQGRLGRNVLWILVIALALVVAGFLAAYGWKANRLAGTNPDHATRQVNAGQFAAPPPASTVRGTDQGRPAAPAPQP